MDKSKNDNTNNITRFNIPLDPTNPKDHLNSGFELYWRIYTVTSTVSDFETHALAQKQDSSP